MEATRSYADSAALTATSPISSLVAPLCRTRARRVLGWVQGLGLGKSTTLDSHQHALAHTHTAHSSHPHTHIPHPDARPWSSAHPAARWQRRRRAPAGQPPGRRRSAVPGRPAGQGSPRRPGLQGEAERREVEAACQAGFLHSTASSQPSIGFAISQTGAKHNESNTRSAINQTAPSRSPSREKGNSAASPMEPGMRGNRRRMGPVITSACGRGWVGGCRDRAERSGECERVFRSRRLQGRV